jgi:hypothetical protein
MALKEPADTWEPFARPNLAAKPSPNLSIRQAGSVQTVNRGQLPEAFARSPHGPPHGVHPCFTHRQLAAEDLQQFVLDLVDRPAVSATRRLELKGLVLDLDSASPADGSRAPVK